MGKARRPEPPKGLKTVGQAFWAAIVGKFDLQDHELLILKECCRTIDLLEDLQAAIDRDGVVLRWGDGVRANPAAPELRQHRLVLTRMVAQLGIPLDPDDDRPARRGGARGPYRMDGRP